jgi:CRP-like cAMP-binding protein
MARHRPARKAGLNRLLGALPKGAYERLLPDLRTVSLGLKEVLYEPDEPITYVYFPNNGVISLVTVMEDGATVEVGTVGNEGMAGLPVFLGADSSPGKAFSQIPGESARMRADALRRHVERGGPLVSLLHRYTQALMAEMAQSIACNRLHSLEERCARWLLMTQDRVGSDRFALTQQFLAQMLGARRPSVTVAAGMLQRAELIGYSRGKIAVLDRKGLEAVSCECYRVVRREFDRLAGGPEAVPSKGPVG